MRSTITAVTSVSVLIYFVSAAACGGATANIDDAGNDAGSGAQSDAGRGGQSDGGTDLGNILGAGCPASVPAIGASCPNPNLTCEYGGEGPHLRCSTIFHCDNQNPTTNQWSANPPGSDCVGTQAENAAACPATFSALASGSACPLPAPGGGTCVFTEGLCECAACAKADGGGSENLWSCKTWPAPASPCPSPRPRAGSACTMEGESCFYGAVCTSVGFDQPDLKCEGGMWHDEPVAQPPCAFPSCGQ